MEKLSFGEKTGYAIGEIAASIVFISLQYFLPIFYTDVYGLTASSVAILFMVVRIFDGLNDPIVGILADRTNTRWGKFRPYLLWMAIPYGIFGVLMFTTPNFGSTGKLIWAYLTYNGMMIIYTVIMIPFNSLSGVMTSNHIERTSLSSFRFVGAFTGAILIQGLAIKMIGLFGKGNQALGYQYTMMVFGVVCVFMFMITFFSVKERVKPISNEKVNIKDDLKDLLKNRPWLILFAVSLFLQIYVFIRNGSIMYYFQYYLGKTELATSFMLVNSLVIIAVLPFTKKTYNYFRQKKSYTCIVST
ncbi:MAG: hypothetical protein HC906_06220 [Bacteroidales bacterium]|nr:hypothetical protein [Bacteroidales bacterium]